MFLTLGTLILGMCSSFWGCHHGEILLTLGTSASGCALHPGDIILGTRSSSQGHHPGNILIIPRKLFQGCAPGYTLINPGTSPRVVVLGCAPHPKDITQGIDSSLWGCHPRDIFLAPGTCFLPWGHNSWGYVVYLRDIILGTCSLHWGHCPQKMLLILGTLFWECAPHPRTSSQCCAHHPGDVILWICSSHWGHAFYPRNITLGLYSSSQKHHPGVVLTILGTSCQICAPHPIYIIWGCSPYPGDVTTPVVTSLSCSLGRSWSWSRQRSALRQKTPVTPTFSSRPTTTTAPC